MNHASRAQPSAAPPFVASGEIVAGKFRVERVLGEGGMGVVVEAMHLHLDERVALKFLKPAMLLQDDVVARFAREAKAAVKLKSEHVARVFDVGVHENGAPFMVMEFLEGSDLRQVLNVRGRLPASEAAEYVIQACEGLAEAHARGIVHRDVKPENLFLAVHDDGWRLIKILDFGISKAALTGNVSGVSLASNETRAIMGSPYYMSPEQLRSTRDVDSRADVWSLGVVLFELLTGTTAFGTTDNFSQLVAEVLEAPHRRLRSLVPAAPAELEAVVDRCLEKNPARRFQSAADVALALLPFAPSRARVPAERALSIARRAGLSSKEASLPRSTPPGSLGETMADLGAEARTGFGAHPTTSGAVLGPKPARSGRKLAFAGAALLAGGALAVFAASARRSYLPLPAEPRAASAPAATLAPKASAVEPAEPAAPTSLASASPSAPEKAPPAAPSATATARPARTARTTRQPPPKLSASAPSAPSAKPSASPSVDIHMAR